MNETLSTPANEYCAQVDRKVRENPGRSLLIAAGVGLAIGILVRALQTQPPATRTERLMADIQHRLEDLSSRAGSLAGTGASLVHDGVDRVRGLHLDRRLRSLGDRVRSIFS
jgi:hypothetical protein